MDIFSHNAWRLSKIELIHSPTPCPNTTKLFLSLWQLFSQCISCEQDNPPLWIQTPSALKLRNLPQCSWWKVPNKAKFDHFCNFFPLSWLFCRLEHLQLRKNAVVANMRIQTSRHQALWSCATCRKAAGGKYPIKHGRLNTCSCATCAQCS